MINLQTLGIAASLTVVCAAACAQRVDVREKPLSLKDLDTRVQYIEVGPPFVPRMNAPLYPKSLNIDYGLPVYFDCPTDEFHVIGKLILHGRPLAKRADKNLAIRCLAAAARDRKADALWLLRSPGVGHALEAYTIKWAE